LLVAEGRKSQKFILDRFKKSKQQLGKREENKQLEEATSASGTN